MSKEKSSNKQKKSKYWGALSWNDSEPSDILDIAKKSNVECCMIVHDKDFNELATPIDYSGTELQPGEKKKVHRHWIFVFPNTTTENHAKEVILGITNGSNPIALSNVKGAFAYLTHKHDPDKYQYDSSEISMFNGFVPENYFNLGAGEEDAATIAIEQIIDRMQFEEYYSLMRYLRENNNDLARFATSHTIHFNSYLKSIKESKRQAKKDKYLDLQIQLAEYKLAECLRNEMDVTTGEVLG